MEVWMPLVVARYSGYCRGVRKAMEKAMLAVRMAPGDSRKVYTLGNLIHNPLALRRLFDAGITEVNSVEDVPAGQVIILRSHGVSPQVLEQCRERGLEVVDCTCSYVDALHVIVQKAYREGLPVILAGERNHPEIIATSSWYCADQGVDAVSPNDAHKCYIVENVQEALQLPKMEKAVALSQTTFPEQEWEKIVLALGERVRDLTVRNTICRATSLRLEEAKALARKSSCMIVVGSRSSANTRRLYEACAGICSRTCLVECAAEIPMHFYDIHKDFIGITAGASTPDWLLEEVVTVMSELEKNVVPEEELSVENETPVEAEQPKPVLTEEEQRNQDFLADLDKSMVRIHNGQTLTGKVELVTADEIGVSIGYKSDGILKREDLVDQDVKVGDEIEVEVVKVNDGEGNVLLSQRNIVNRKVWDALMEKYEKGEYVDAVGKEAVKGGLLASCDGVRAFVPASRLALNFVDKINQFVGQPMKLKIIDVDQQKKRIVASRKDVLIEEAAARKAEAWDRLVEGDVVKGIVRRFANFGAFVDLGGVDGLIHVTDLSWGHVNHPSDVLKIDQEIDVKILSLDRERQRIQLGYKQLQPRPWDNVEEKYQVGDVLERPVVRIREFGAFVELEPGVDGLVHISQCALTRVNKVEDVLTVGQPVRVKVLAVDPEAKRISLSVRAVLEDERLANQAAEMAEMPEMPETPETEEAESAGEQE